MTPNKALEPTACRGGSETWTKIASDTGTVDIGYHHCRVDCYLGGDTTFSGSGASLTISPGVVVGVLGGKYLKASNGGAIRSVGDPSAGGLNLITCSKALSMNIESPDFCDTTGNPYIYLCSGASEASSIQYTRMTWLGWGVVIDPGRWLREPIQHNVFSLSYYGILAGSNTGNVLFNNLFYDNVQGAYADGDAQGRAAVRNCTFDKNWTGLFVSPGSGGMLAITDCLFTNNFGEGILISAGGGTVNKDYNGYYGNAQDINGGTWGANSWSDKPGAPHALTQSPYYSGIETGWQLHYTLNQTSPLIDAGSRTAAAAWLDEFTTAPEEDNRTDVKEVDIGFHFPLEDENMVQKGCSQTDVALRYRNMTMDCIRAFPLDGDATDEIANEDATAANISWANWRYDPTYLSHLKYDYSHCATFGGSSSRVDCGCAADLHSMTDFTVAAWIYTAQEVAGARICQKGIGDQGWYLALKWSGGVGGLVGDVQCSALPHAHSETATYNITKNKWTHVAMTWNNSAKEIFLYVDGVDRTSGDTRTPGGGGKAGDPSGHLWIGCRQTGAGAWGSYFQGRMADFLVYDRVLTVSEIGWLALKSDGGWLVTPNLGAMGEGPRHENDETDFPVGQMHSAAYAVEDGDNNIWVSEFGVPRISKINQLGRVVLTIGGKWSSDPGEVYGPWGLDFDADGNLYECDEGNDRVQVFSPNGDLLDDWGYGRLEDSYCLAVHGNSVYVADSGHWRVCKFTTGGAFLGWWGLDDWGQTGWHQADSPRAPRQAAGDQTRGPGEFYALRGITTDSAGNVWVVDVGDQGDKNYLQKFTCDGGFLERIYGDAPSGGMGQGLAMSSDKYLFTTNGEFSPYSTLFAKWTTKCPLNKTYRLSGWVYIPTVGKPTAYVRLGTWNLQNNVTISANLNILDQWQYLTGTFTGGSEWNGDPFPSYHPVVCGTVSTAQGMGLACFDDLSLQEVGETGEILQQGDFEDTWYAIDNGPPGALTEEASTVHGGAKAAKLTHTAGQSGYSYFSKAINLKRIHSHGVLGTGQGQAYNAWGQHVTPRGTLFTTDWFCCRIQEWDLYGNWIRDIWWPLRSDGHSIKCKNDSSGPRVLYQRLILSEGDYRVQFAAFTNGSEVLEADVIPFAARAPEGTQQNPNPEADPDDNAFTNPSYGYDYSHESYVLTPVQITSPGSSMAAFVWGEFTVLPGEGGEWNIGAQVQANNLVYVASLTCVPK